MGVLVNKDGVKDAGGYLLSAMPDATDEDITKIEKSIFEAGAMSKMLENNLSLYDIARKVTGDKNVKVIEKELKPVYKCDCSKEKIERALSSLNKEELKKIIEEDGKAEIICHFCNKKYNFSKEELLDIFNKK